MSNEKGTTTVVSQDVERWKRELEAAGWNAASATAWYAPDGGLYRGPYGAWKELQRRRGVLTATDTDAAKAREIIGNVNNYAEDDGELSISACNKRDMMTTKAQSTTEETARLLPCPLFGHLPDKGEFTSGPYISVSGAPNMPKFYAVVCPGCCSTAYDEDKERVIRKWNTRVPASTAPVVNTGGFQCSCCGRNMEIRINGEFCNECAGHQSALRRVLGQIINDLPTKRDWLDPALEQEALALTGRITAAATTAPVEQSDSLLAKITQIADIGSAEEFGDAIERLRAIRKLIATADEGAR